MIKNTLDHYALTVVGDSMQPTFKAGSVLFVDPDGQWMSGSFVIVENEQGHKLFRRVDQNADAWYLVPLNAHYPSLPLDNFRVVGVVYQSTPGRFTADT